MTIIYVKTNEQPDKYGKVQVQYQSTNQMIVKLLARSDSSIERLFKVTSFTMTEDEIISKLTNWSTQIDKIQAHLLGKQLQPDRDIEDEVMGETYHYSFSLLDLSEAKQIKIDQISDKTKDLIYAGYQYTFSNGDTKTFPMNDINQLNWEAVSRQYDKGNITDDYFDSTTKDGEKYSIPTSELDTFTGGMFLFKKQIKDAGRDLKSQIYNCTTIEEVGDIIDNR